MNVKKSVILAFLVAAGILLQLLESFVGVFMIVPGYKIGLANIAGLFALYMYDEKSMAYVSLLRIFLSSLMQGTLFSVSFWLSLSGGLLACLAMIIAYKSKVFSIYGVSILGASFHNIGQVIAITWIYQQYFMQLFLPILLALSIVSGILIAVICKKVLNHINGGSYGKI
ncbi:heptaprenyl diphosphate synthase [Eubacterium sp. AF22-8LB]|uniref:Gx transporter family protein n=1 Tax=Eubacterium sp. AF22-8LB TaxID=2292232 RepID=UPI000E4E99EF|nr:Gx transporter family protein [Eubacterium sp. AF22-8LB]RGS31170.1 heptaprenyl diphosphate synthase [Eubacterium sp. AF22-8LB]